MARKGRGKPAQHGGDRSGGGSGNSWRFEDTPVRSGGFASYSAADLAAGRFAQDSQPEASPVAPAIKQLMASDVRIVRPLIHPEHLDIITNVRSQVDTALREHGVTPHPLPLDELGGAVLLGGATIEYITSRSPALRDMPADTFLDALRAGQPPSYTDEILSGKQVMFLGKSGAPDEGHTGVVLRLTSRNARAEANAVIDTVYRASEGQVAIQTNAMLLLGRAEGPLILPPLKGVLTGIIEPAVEQLHSLRFAPSPQLVPPAIPQA